MKTKDLNRLKQGHVQFLKKGFELPKGSPSLAILTCMDARMPVEKIFNLQVGEAFVIRMAAHVVTNEVLGCLEYATIAGVHSIFVLGHTDCAGIKAACDGNDIAHIKNLVEMIQPAVSQVHSDAQSKAGEGRLKPLNNSHHPDFVTNVMQRHLTQSQKRICEKSALLRDLIHQGELSLSGAIYDVMTGAVEFQSD